MRSVTRDEKPWRSTANAPPALHTCFLGALENQAAAAAQLLFQQAHGVFQTVSPQGVGADQLSKVRAVMGWRHLMGLHFHQFHIDIPLGQLPSSLTPSQTRAYYGHCTHAVSPFSPSSSCFYTRSRVRSCCLLGGCRLFGGGTLLFAGLLGRRRLFRGGFLGCRFLGGCFLSLSGGGFALRLVFSLGGCLPRLLPIAALVLRQEVFTLLIDAEGLHMAAARFLEHGLTTDGQSSSVGTSQDIKPHSAPCSQA